MKRFKAVFSNHNPVNGRNYYTILNMSDADKALYKADKGEYYIENEAGLPTISFANNPGENILVSRAEKPNPNTGEYSWFSAGRTIEQIENDLCGEFPNIAKFNFARIQEMAQATFKNQFKKRIAEQVTEDDSSLDEL